MNTEHTCVEVGNAYFAPYRPCAACEAERNPKECTALVPYDPFFHSFSYRTVADNEHYLLMKSLREFGREIETTAASFREAARLLRNGVAA